MAESKTNENVVKMTETGAVRVIAAALQSGVLKLPYSTAFPQKLSEALESRSIETWVRHDKVPVQEVLDGRLMSQFVLPARADGLYLLRFHGYSSGSPARLRDRIMMQSVNSSLAAGCGYGLEATQAPSSPINSITCSLAIL